MGGARDIAHDIEKVAYLATSGVVTLLEKRNRGFEYPRDTVEGERLVLRVLLRRYFLCCWEHLTSHPGTDMSRLLSGIVLGGGFRHHICLFNFLLSVTLEQSLVMYPMWKRMRERDVDTDATEVSFLDLYVSTTRTPTLLALRNSTLGCSSHCQYDDVGCTPCGN